MNRPSPKTVRRRFLMALGHVVHVTWPVLSTIAASNAALTEPVPTRSSYEGTQAHQPVWRRGCGMVARITCADCDGRGFGRSRFARCSSTDPGPWLVYRRRAYPRVSRLIQ